MYPHQQSAPRKGAVSQWEAVPPGKGSLQPVAIVEAKEVTRSSKPTNVSRNRASRRLYHSWAQARTVKECHGPEQLQQGQSTELSRRSASATLFLAFGSFRFRNIATSHCCCGTLNFAIVPTVSAAMHATLRHAHETTF